MEWTPMGRGAALIMREARASSELGVYDQAQEPIKLGLRKIKGVRKSVFSRHWGPPSN